MTFADLTPTHKWIIVGGLTVVLGGSVWGVSRKNAGPRQPELPKELTVASLKAGAANPGQAMDTMRAAMEREDLTDEQRRQARQNMREVFESAINDRVNEYYTASEEEKVAVLDKHIDEMAAWRAEWEKRQAEREKDQNREGGRGMGPGGPGSSTREERKEQSESRNPDQMAQRMAYFMALQGRATQRGISMPWGGGGRGPGGGRQSGGRRGP